MKTPQATARGLHRTPDFTSHSTHRVSYETEEGSSYKETHRKYPPGTRRALSCKTQKRIPTSRDWKEVAFSSNEA